ncbi:MAG: T9SS type A sorting domain-containing protein, partial [Chitinophagaceae bacterium]|nr:T9SS type A sorting domain-containing protein [Chitinophagaceae bacterium]
HNLATLNISLAKKQLLQLYIIDAKGTRLYQKNIAAQSGFISEQINTEHLAQGVYTIVVVAESGERKTIRFVKQ